jgi:dihydroneopterin aldolase
MILGTIQLTGMEFYAYHGHFEEEKKIGTQFKVDVKIVCDMEAAIQTDELSKTVNYQTVWKKVKEEMDKPSNILEHLTYRILQTLTYSFPEIVNLEVTVYKLNPSIGSKTETAAVTLKI